MQEDLKRLLVYNCEGLNIHVLIRGKWYKLEEVYDFDKTNLSMPIFVSDEDGETHEYDYMDIEDFENIKKEKK